MFFSGLGATSTNDIDTNVHMDPLHSSDYKTWYPKYKQPDTTQSERGDMHSLSPHLGPNLIIIITITESRTRGLGTV